MPTSPTHAKTDSPSSGLDYFKHPRYVTRSLIPSTERPKIIAPPKKSGRPRPQGKAWLDGVSPTFEPAQPQTFPPAQTLDMAPFFANSARSDPVYTGCGTGGQDLACDIVRTSREGC